MAADGTMLVCIVNMRLIGHIVASLVCHIAHLLVAHVHPNIVELMLTSTTDKGVGVHASSGLELIHFRDICKRVKLNRKIRKYKYYRFGYPKHSVKCLQLLDIRPEESSRPLRGKI